MRGKRQWRNARAPDWRVKDGCYRYSRLLAPLKAWFDQQSKGNPVGW
jgi:hypothetical protein